MGGVLPFRHADTQVTVERLHTEGQLLDKVSSPWLKAAIPVKRLICVTTQAARHSLCQCIYRLCEVTRAASHFPNNGRDSRMAMARE